MGTTFQHPSGNALHAVQLRPSDSGLSNSQLNYLRGIVMDFARIRLETAAIADFTDNSSGTAASDSVALTVPTAAVDCTATNGAQATDFNATMNEMEAAFAVMAEHLNNVRARLGLPALTWTTGTITTKGTIPACGTSITAAQGATAVNFTEGAAVLTICRNNYATILRALNEICAALGEPTLTENSGGTPSGAYAIGALADAAADTTNAGATSILSTVADAFCAALVNNIATVAAKYAALFFQSGITDLTDSSGGTSEGDALATAGSAIAAHQDGGTDSAPKAGLDAELAKLENNFADLTARLNLLRARYNLTELTDSTTGTANTTLEVIDDTLTAVDGTGSNSAAYDGWAAVRAKIDANVATLIDALNDLCPYFGEAVITDSFGGTVSATGTMVEIGTTGSGVDNGAAATGMANADVNAYLDRVTDAFATIAAKLNDCTGSVVATTGAVSKPMHVVAALS